MGEPVLLVDDEANILKALRRVLTEMDLEVLEAERGEDALRLLEEHDVAVIVSDNMMPGMRGIELLSRAKELRPDAARILMTGYADLRTAVEAINRGEVFRFLVKPWSNEEFLQAMDAGLLRFRTVRSLQAGDAATLRTIAQMIELKDHYTRGHCDRVAFFAQSIGKALGLGEAVLKEIEQGSWLHDCGKIGVPEAILNFEGPLGGEEKAVVRQHPFWGAEVARQAGLPRAVTDIVLHHHERWDGKGYPMGLAGERIPLEARIVAVADTYDALISDRPYRKGVPADTARKILEEVAGAQLDPRLVALFLGREAADV
ncbi:MAG: HD domain-containing phosphohydrolase [Thermodesulfobacteriota bacterium]